jgi:hypothetical protein
LSAGHAHDGRQFETLYESLDPDNVLESSILDKGYDADRIRERLSYDGIQPSFLQLAPGVKSFITTRNSTALATLLSASSTKSNTSDALQPATTSYAKPSLPPSAW